MEQGICNFDNALNFNCNQGRPTGIKNKKYKGIWRVKMPTSQMISYRVLLKKEPEGGYTITVPSLPGCVTYGESIEEATKMAKEAMELYIESLKAHHEEISNEDGVLECTLKVKINA